MPSSGMVYIPRGLNPLDGGAVLQALPVWVEPLKEGQSSFYLGMCVMGQPIVAILYRYLTVHPGKLPVGETQGGSHDPCKRGIWGDVTTVAHGILILIAGCETFPPLEV